MNQKLIAADRSGANQTSTVLSTIPSFTQGLNAVFNNTRDLTAFGKANLEAVNESGRIWAAGVQDLSKHVASTAKASFDESVETFKALAAAKSVREAIDLQGNYGKSAVASAVQVSQTLTDASIKLTEQAMAPLTARVAVAIETFAKQPDVAFMRSRGRGDASPRIVDPIA